MKITYKSLLYISLAATTLFYSCDNEIVDYGQTIDDVETGTADLTDTDGDGLSDVAENMLLGQDTDSDNIPDYLDDDDDNDGVLTVDEMPDENGNGVPDDSYDLDGDDIPNYLDTDDDGDGVLTEDEGPLVIQDTDEDGVLDYLDDDDDNDGVPTLVENGGTLQNSDSDGTPDYLDTDDDNDGILTMYEDYENGLDSDGDGILNYLEEDDDGDGKLSDFENADPDGDGDPVDAYDSDGDGTPDYLDIYNYDMTSCDGSDSVVDNFALFDLELYVSDVMEANLPTGASITVSFHTSENGAYYNNNMVSSTTDYVNSSQSEDIVYMRIMDNITSTFTIEELYLFVIVPDTAGGTAVYDTFGNECL
ncbi:hypothetical protein NBRC110019_06860 [Neptunitalea chrysea]|uniref:Uncharacterized protein n=1 Tax=Neptunitalea chrysea TaxID=1647581 RepID=A0A9W6B4F4_9FLAO|nr:hypothetical protein [Neptunitalea chrysea]GLB51647.1 hypothetical protein NBRC110019_06860 [Neptunitalea chrysea]